MTGGDEDSNNDDNNQQAIIKWVYRSKKSSTFMVCGDEVVIKHICFYAIAFVKIIEQTLQSSLIWWRRII